MPRYSLELNDLLRRILSFDSAARPSIEEIIFNILKMQSYLENESVDQISIKDEIVKLPGGYLQVLKDMRNQALNTSSLSNFSIALEQLQNNLRRKAPKLP